MEQLSYSFLITMLHSTWQMALLLGVTLVLVANGRTPPLIKRNVLLAALLLQVLASIITFYYSYYNYHLSPGLFFHSEFSLLFNEIYVRQFAPLLFFIYLLVVAGKLMLNARNWFGFTNSYRRGLVKVPSDLKLFTRARALHFGIRRRVSIWCSDHISTPVTFGFFKPVILLPVALLNSLTMQEAETLILHELNHIRHHDYLLNWCLVVAESLFFFNPFVKIAAQRIRIEREKNCDLQVLHFKYSHLVYAEALLKTAQCHQKKVSLQLAAVQQQQQLLQRIHFFSKAANQLPRTRSHSLAYVMLAAAFLANLLLVSRVPWPAHTRVPSFAASTVLPLPRGESTVDSRKNITTTTVATSALEKPSLRPTASTPAVAATAEQVSEIKSSPELLPPLVEMETTAFPNYSIPVVNTTVSVTGKEIMITEESSDGKKLTIALKAVLVNGEWIMQPLWMTSEKRATADSNHRNVGDSVIRVYPTIQ